MPSVSGMKVWWSSDEPPTKWKCPHCDVTMWLEDVKEHTSVQHATCYACTAESMLVRGILAVVSIPEIGSHHQ